MSPALQLSLKTRSAPVTYTTLVIWVSVMICLVAICGGVALLVFIKHRLRQSRSDRFDVAMEMETDRVSIRRSQSAMTH
ncbi:hypothetical protein N7486_002697 [Penicillium sp. IBT 16267x]|nr:hypothetical protein N7486_002697 [Penicillium sp. IBT 16267x]